MRSDKRLDRTAMGLSALLLLGAAADRASLAPPIDPTAYHQQICALAGAVSWNQSDWYAVEQPTQERVGTWIHANIFRDILLTNALTGHSVNLLIEHCDDARDLIPHFPAVCYPSRGMDTMGVWNRDWKVGDMTIQGTEYLFDQNEFQAGGSLIVDNFMILPTGQFCREMKEVKRELPVADRYVGLAQFQIVFPATIPQAQREADLRQILLPCCDLIRAIRHGPGT